MRITSTLRSIPHTGININRCLNGEGPVWTGIEGDEQPDEPQRQPEDGTPHHHYVEPEGPPLQHVPVLPRVEPDGLNHQHIAEHSIAKHGLPLQPDDLHRQRVPDLPKAGHEGPHLMQVSVLSTAERGLLNLQEHPDGPPQLYAPELTKAERRPPPA